MKKLLSILPSAVLLLSTFGASAECQPKSDMTAMCTVYSRNPMECEYASRAVQNFSAGAYHCENTGWTCQLVSQWYSAGQGWSVCESSLNKYNQSACLAHSYCEWIWR